MTTTGSAAALLHVAIQDLYAGKTAQAQRLPGIADRCSDPALVAVLRAEVERVAAQAQRIRGTGLDVEGPKNLWMNGILDDAERDTRSTQKGRLLDIALIGAVRKGKAAEIVSSETAIALAREEGAQALLAAITANRADEIECDQQLKARLEALTAAG